MCLQRDWVCVEHIWAYMGHTRPIYGSYEAHMGLGAKEGGQCRQWGEDWEWRISGIGCYQQIQDNPSPPNTGSHQDPLITEAGTIISGATSGLNH